MSPSHPPRRRPVLWHRWVLGIIWFLQIVATTIILGLESHNFVVLRNYYIGKGRLWADDLATLKVNYTVLAVFCGATLLLVFIEVILCCVRRLNALFYVCSAVVKVGIWWYFFANQIRVHVILMVYEDRGAEPSQWMILPLIECGASLLNAIYAVVMKVKFARQRRRLEDQYGPDMMVVPSVHDRGRRTSMVDQQNDAEPPPPYQHNSVATAK